MTPKIKTLIKRLLVLFGFQIQRIRRPPSGKPNPINIWEEDEEYNCIWRQICNFTLIDKIRCFMIYQFGLQVITKEGDIAEVGVYKGGSGRLLSKVFKHTNKKIYLFDTFSGMPESDPQKDWHRKGDFSDTSVESVKYYLRDCENILIYTGLFPGSANNLEDKKFCLVHVDCDIYKSVIDCCNFFYPKMVSGGILIFDDYGCITCPGAKIAVDEFFLHKPERICYLPTGSCFVIKR